MGRCFQNDCKRRRQVPCTNNASQSEEKVLLQLSLDYALLPEGA